MRRLGTAILLLVGLLLGAAPAAHAQAEKRLALLIGNQAYGAGVGPLKNPHNDIRIVGTALAKVGFQVLTPVEDATRDRLLTAVHEFADKLKAAGPDAIGFLYYAGHGVAVGNDNVVVPVNVQGTTRRELEISGVRLGEIIGILNDGAPQAVHFVVFDACRNLVGSSRGTRGFVPIAERPGMLIAFSTAPNSPASDGDGKGSGPYAAALSEELMAAGRYHGDMFFEVRTKVAAATGQEQVPWTQDGLLRRVHFGGEAAVAVPPPPAKSQATEAAEGWAVTKDTQSIAALEAFVRRFGDTYYGDLAKMRLDELRRAETAKEAAAAKKKADDEARAKAEGERVCSNVENTQNVAQLKTMASIHKGTPAGACIAARIDVLQKQQAAAADPPITKGLYAPPLAPLTPDQERALKPKDAFRECPECPEMVVVPAGNFMMGSPPGEEGRNADEGPRRKVTIARPFAVGKYEVTFAEWDACVAGGGCKLTPVDQGWGRGRHPLMNVSWDDITKEFLPWLSRRTGKSYRLLTEAEWEYAARAGTTTPFATGKTITTDQANFDGSSTYGGSAKGMKRGKTVEVGSFAPNAFGLYDMHGNVWELVQDCLHDNYNGAPTDGSARTTGTCDLRVLRSGSFSVDPQYVRSADRNGSAQANRFVGTGLRLARTLTGR